MDARGGRPMLLIDLAVPRDIDAACGELDGVSLYDIDDLQAVVAATAGSARPRRARPRGSSRRRSSTSRPGSARSRCCRRSPRCARAPPRSPSRSWRENAGKWESASPRDLERVDALARAVVNRLLHEPTAADEGAARRSRPRPDGARARPVRPRARRAATSPSAAQEPPDGRPRADEPVRALVAGAEALMRIGTRGSALALAQARWVAERLERRWRARDDHHRGRPRRAVGDKSRWVSELERALLDGEIDLAVHSAKDVPAELAAGLELVAIPARADARDAICGAPSLAALAPGGARRHEQPAPRGADPRGARRPRRGRGHAATSTPGCASSPTARSTRSCSRSPACSGSAARRGRRRARRARPGRRSGRARARGAGRRDSTGCARRVCRPRRRPRAWPPSAS